MKWTDPQRGKRRHSLLTKQLAATLPALGDTDGAQSLDEAKLCVKLFSPYSGWKWYITEYDADSEHGECFGYVEGFENEWGYFSLAELASTEFKLTPRSVPVPAIERDLHWQPCSFADLKEGS